MGIFDLFRSKEDKYDGGIYQRVVSVCPKCGGNIGVLHQGSTDVCPRCNGSGMIEEYQRVEKGTGKRL